MRCTLDKNARQLLAIHLRLAAKLSPRDWEYVDQVTTTQEHLSLKEATARQTKKFEGLGNSKVTSASLNPDRIVINLSGRNISETAKSVLSKGLNFAPAPRTMPYQDFIGAIEPALRFLPQESAEEARSKIASALKKATPPRSSLSREEREALKDLKDNRDVVILPADKGNATVLMERYSYTRRIQEILKDGSYKVIACDLTDTLTRKTSTLFKESGLPPDTIKSLLPQAPAPP
ncbi:hypothetical protein J437_LFUL000728 [Ladona fulva]|uniref:Uncharacterized protein n=1 Tax=Ladona fulva TaxID=123851 RepID=A0A8K0JTH7_LADFU|nr:hypothetical protein J437_LFUL000728 [Ladona fulva]